MKYYAVRVGRIPNIYTDWPSAKAQVDGYTGNKYRSFNTLAEAEAFMRGETEPPKGHIPPSESPKIPLLFTQIPSPQPTVTPTTPTTETIIYTDGSCVHSRGGYGFVVIRPNQEPQGYAGKVLTYPTTNQQAELTAILMALQTVRDPNILIRTDSRYSIGCLTEWYPRWEREGWRTASGGPVENKGLIQEVLAEMRSKPVRSIRFEHVYGHRGNYYNELADQLADQGRQM